MFEPRVVQAICHLKLSLHLRSPIAEEPVGLGCVGSQVSVYHRRNHWHLFVAVAPFYVAVTIGIVGLLLWVSLAIKTSAYTKIYLHVPCHWLSPERTHSYLITLPRTFSLLSIWLWHMKATSHNEVAPSFASLNEVILTSNPYPFLARRLHSSRGQRANIMQSNKMPNL